MDYGVEHFPRHLCFACVCAHIIRPRGFEAKHSWKATPSCRSKHLHTQAHDTFTIVRYRNMHEYDTNFISAMTKSTLFARCGNGMCAGRFRTAVCFIRRNICKINLVRAESVQSSYGFVHNIKEKRKNRQKEHNKTKSPCRSAMSQRKFYPIQFGCCCFFPILFFLRIHRIFFWVFCMRCWCSCCWIHGAQPYRF